MDEQVLKDLVATAQNYNYDWNVVTPKFPELSSYDLQLLKDYVATAENYNYDYSIVNSKFPEFFQAPAPEEPAPEEPAPEVKKKDIMEPSLEDGSLVSPESEPSAPPQIVDESLEQSVIPTTLGAFDSPVTGETVDVRETAYQDPVEALMQAGITDEAEIQLAVEQREKDRALAQANIEAEAPALEEFLKEEARKEEEQVKKRKEEGVLEEDSQGRMIWLLEGVRNKVEESFQLTNPHQIEIALRNNFDFYGFYFNRSYDDKLTIISPDGRKKIQVDLKTPDSEEQLFLVKNFVSSYYELDYLSHKDDLKKGLTTRFNFTDLPELAAKVKASREVGRRNKDGSVSTVLMASGEVDGEYVAFPTLFPKDPENYGAAPEYWQELPFGEALDLAIERGEVYFFDTDEEAKEFAEGSWKDVTDADYEGQAFYDKRGLNYMRDKRIVDTYTKARDIVLLIEDDEVPFRQNELTPEDQEKYAELYINGKRREDLQDVKNKYASTVETLEREYLDDEYQNVREDFDVYMQKRYESEVQKAIQVNEVAKSQLASVANKSLELFGVADPRKIQSDNNEAELLLLEFEGAKMTAEAAADQYENAKLFFDNKHDKSAKKRYSDNWEAFTDEVSEAYSRGKAGDVILMYSMMPDFVSGYDSDDPASTRKVAEELVRHMSKESETKSRVMSRWQRARGFNESLDVVLDDPAEWMATLAGTSLSQMAPYGVKIVPASTIGGTAVGAAVGASAAGAGAIPGAALGFSRGMRVGFAATNLALEYTNAVTDAMRELGYKIDNPEDVAKALQNKDVWDKGRKKGLERGVPIAVVDYLSAGLAGRVFRVSPIARKGNKIARQTAERFVFDPAAEAFGELAAQVSAGQEVDWKEIAAEAGGGPASNTASMAVNMAIDARFNNDVELASRLTDFQYMANVGASSQRITDWTNNMLKLGKIDEETAKRINDNVGVLRDAQQLLGVGRRGGKYRGRNKGTLEGRLSLLLAARADFQATANSREVYADRIKRINDEIKYIVDNKSMLPEDQQVLLLGYEGQGTQSALPTYTIRRGFRDVKVTREEFIKRLREIDSKEKFSKFNGTVENDEEIAAEMMQKAELFQEEEEVDLEGMPEKVEEEADETVVKQSQSLEELLVERGILDEQVDETDEGKTEEEVKAERIDRDRQQPERKPRPKPTEEPAAEKKVFALEIIGEKMVNDKGVVGTIKEENGGIVWESEDGTEVIDGGGRENASTVTINDMRLSFPPDVTPEAPIELTPETKQEFVPAEQKTQEELEVMSELEVEEARRKVDEDVQEFEDTILDEIERESENERILFKFKGSEFAVSQKPDGTFVVSKKNAKGKYVSVSNKKQRADVIAEFEDIKEDRDNERLRLAEELVLDYKQELLEPFGEKVERPKVQAPPKKKRRKSRKKGESVTPKQEAAPVVEEAAPVVGEAPVPPQKKSTAKKKSETKVETTTKPSVKELQQQKDAETVAAAQAKYGIEDGIKPKVKRKKATVDYQYENEDGSKTIITFKKNKNGTLAKRGESVTQVEAAPVAEEAAPVAEETAPVAEEVAEEVAEPKRGVLQDAEFENILRRSQLNPDLLQEELDEFAEYERQMEELQDSPAELKKVKAKEAKRKNAIKKARRGKIAEIEKEQEQIRKAEETKRKAEERKETKRELNTAEKLRSEIATLTKIRDKSKEGTDEYNRVQSAIDEKTKTLNNLLGVTPERKKKSEPTIKPKTRQEKKAASDSKKKQSRISKIVAKARKAESDLTELSKQLIEAQEKKQKIFDSDKFNPRGLKAADKKIASLKAKIEKLNQSKKQLAQELSTIQGIQFQLNTKPSEINVQLKEQLLESAMEVMDEIGFEETGITLTRPFESYPINVTDNLRLVKRAGRMPLVELVGSRVNLLMADRLKVDENRMGGPLFAFQDGIFGYNIAWASIDEAAARRIATGAANSDYSVVYNMSSTGIDSNMVLFDLLFDKIEATRRPRKIFRMMMERMQTLRFDEKASETVLTEKIHAIAKKSKNVKTFLAEVEKLGADARSSIFKKVTPTSDINSRDAFLKILQEENINADTLRAELSEQLADDLPMGSLITVLKITDKQGNPVTNETIDEALVFRDEQKKMGVKDHRNYPVYLRGYPVAILSDTAPFWNMSEASLNEINNQLSLISKEDLSLREVIRREERSAQFGANKVFEVQSPTDIQYASFVEKLSSAFPTLEVAATKQEFERLLKDPEVKKLTTKSQKIYGAVYQGKLYLNPGLANYNTPVHEFGHVWMNAAKELRPDLYKKGIELVKQSQYLDQVRNSADYSQLIARMKRQGMSQAEIDAYIAEEALATAIGDKGESFVNAAQKRNFKSWLNDLFKFIKKLTGISKFTEEQVQNLTFDEFLQGVVVDLMSENELFEGAESAKLASTLQLMSAPSNQTMINIIETARASGKHSDATIKEFLKAKGYKVDEINAALADKARYFELMPESFRKIVGGYNAASKLFNETRLALAEFKKKTQATNSEVRAKAKELLESHSVFNEQTEQVQKEIMLGFDNMLGIKANKNVAQEIANIRNNLKQRKIAVKNLKAEQKAMRDFIRRNLILSKNYSSADVVKLLNALSDATTPEKFEAVALKALNIIERQKVVKKKDLISEIKKLVTRKTIKNPPDNNQRVRPRGLDAQGESFFEQAQRIVDAYMNIDKFPRKIQEIENELASQEGLISELLGKEERGERRTSEQQSLLDLAYAYDILGGMDSMTADEISDVLDALKGEKKKSAIRLKESRLARKAKYDAVIGEANRQLMDSNPLLFNEDGKPRNTNEIQEKKDEIAETFLKRGFLNAIKTLKNAYDVSSKASIFKSLATSFKSLKTFMNRLDRVTQGKNVFTKNVYDKINMMIEVRNDYNRKTLSDLDSIARDAGFDNYVALKKALYVGTLKIGTKRMHGNQALRVYALYQNEVQRKKLNRQGIGDKEIQQIKDALGSKAIKFADGVVNYLSTTYYNQVNDVHIDVNDVGVPFVENYFPTKTLIQNQEMARDLLGSDGSDFMKSFDAQTQSALKQRIDTEGEVELYKTDFTSALEYHYTSMNKFRAYAMGVKEINALLSSPAVKTLLDLTGLTNPVRAAINHEVNPERTMVLTQGSPIVNFLMSRFVSLMLNFKIWQIPKQFSSFMGAFGDYDYTGKDSSLPNMLRRRVDFPMFILENLVTMALLPLDLMALLPGSVKRKGLIAMMREKSATFDERATESLSGEVYNLVGNNLKVSEPDALKRLTYNQRRALSILSGEPIRKIGNAMGTGLGDILGIIGYITNYKRNIKNGMSEEEALKVFNNYNTTQQSRRTTDKAAVQNNPALANKFFTLFASMPLLMINNVMSAALNISRDVVSTKPRMPRTEDLRSFALNLGVINVAFVATANFFKFTKGDDEDRDEVYQDLINAAMGVNLLLEIPMLSGIFQDLDAAGRIMAAVKGEDYKRKFQIRSGTAVDPLRQIYYRINREMKEGKGAMESTLKTSLELGLGASSDPAVGIGNLIRGRGFTKQDGIESVKDFYDLMGVSKSYRPSYLYDEEKKSKEKSYNYKFEFEKEMDTEINIINNEMDLDLGDDDIMTEQDLMDEIFEGME